MATAQEKGHIGSQRKRQRHQLGGRQSQTPQALQSQQAAGGVGRAAAHTGLRWNPLFKADVHPQGGAGGRLQGARSAYAEVFSGQVLMYGHPQVGAGNHAVAPQLKVQRVTPVDQHKHRLQQVVSIGTPARDV